MSNGNEPAIQSTKRFRFFYKDVYIYIYFDFQLKHGRFKCLSIHCIYGRRVCIGCNQTYIQIQSSKIGAKQIKTYKLKSIIILLKTIFRRKKFPFSIFVAKIYFFFGRFIKTLKFCNYWKSKTDK